MRIVESRLIQIIKEEIQERLCPLATQDKNLNAENKRKAAAAKDIKYGHPDEVPELKKLEEKGQLCGNCAAFNITDKMVDCGGASKDGTTGYCEMHRFTCAADKTCLTWASGGPKRLA